MGEHITFPSNGHTCHGYLATPATGSGPGVVVIQEYWGLVPHIQDVADRFAAEGFVALAPDLYHGETATEPDEAAKLMMALDLPRVARDMSGAVDALLARSTGEAVGVVGFCMGGGLALWLATLRPEIAEAVVFYGVIPWPEAKPDFSNITGHVLGFFAEHDDFASPEQVRKLEGDLSEAGIPNELTTYADSEHAFFNDDRPEVYNAQASDDAWRRTVDAFRTRLS